MYNQQVKHIIKKSILQLKQEMNATAPFMAKQVTYWLENLAGTTQAENYFLHPKAFPMVLLPWSLEKTCYGKVDIYFQSNLAYSTINGYYYIRLIDNIMDADTDINLMLLPALNFFHTHFQSTYHRYFPANHPFWQDFKRIWCASGELTMRDTALVNINLTQFKQIAAQKVSAIKIPIMAVCYHYHQVDLIPTWFEFVELLGCWHQMINDVFDWHKDLTHHTNTYFLAEAKRYTTSNEGLVNWVMQKGFYWASQILNTWLNELKIMAQHLQSKALVDYLIKRETLFLKQQQEVIIGFENMVKLLRIV